MQTKIIFGLLRRLINNNPKCQEKVVSFNPHKQNEHQHKWRRGSKKETTDTTERKTRTTAVLYPRLTIKW